MTVDSYILDVDELEDFQETSTTLHTQDKSEYAQVVQIVQRGPQDEQESDLSIKYLHGSAKGTRRMDFIGSDMDLADLSLRSLDEEATLFRSLAALRSRLAHSNVNGAQIAESLNRIADASSALGHEARFQGFIAFLVAGPPEVRTSAAQALASFGELRAIPHLQRIVNRIADGEGVASIREALTELRERARRKERYRQAIDLLETWEAEDSDYDERAWPEIKEGLSAHPVRFWESGD